MLNSVRLRNLPGYAKLFVAIFTVLMLCVGLWAAWLYSVAKGSVDTDHLPAYLRQNAVDDDTASADINDDINAIASDSESVIAPMWDSAHAGREVPYDSADADTLEAYAGQDDGNDSMDGGTYASEVYGPTESHLRHNLGLAHTHINGQTLLFFALGFIFLFSSATPRTKKTAYWIFGLSIVVHVIGLSGQGYSQVYDDILAVSGVVMLTVIAYMAFMILVDLAKKRENADA